MKKLIVGIIIGSALTATTSVFADTTLHKIEAYLNPSLPITLDGNKLNLQNAPITYDGNTYLPLRETATILGKDVNWNDATQTVELSSKGNTNTPTEPVGVKNGSNKVSFTRIADEIVQYENDTYLALPSGSVKYGVRHNVMFDDKNKVVYFKDTSVSVHYTDGFEVGCDAFNNKEDGHTYLKEGFFLKAKEEVEKAQK